MRRYVKLFENAEVRRFYTRDADILREIENSPIYEDMLSLADGDYSLPSHLSYVEISDDIVGGGVLVKAEWDVPENYEYSADFDVSPRSPKIREYLRYL